MARQLKSITVGELIAALQDEDPEAEVCFASNYGDFGKTQQVLGIRGEIERAEIEESAYSESGWAIATPEAEDPEDEAFADPPGPSILVIR